MIDHLLVWGPKVTNNFNETAAALIIRIKVTVTLCKVPLLHFSINRPTTDRLKSISQSNECTLRLKNIPAQVQRSGEGPSFESPLIHFKYERIIVLA